MPKETFSARFENLEAMCQLVDGIARSAGLSESETYGVVLAANEAFTNIIEHGYGGDSDEVIELSVSENSDGVVIIIRDWGEAFDPDEIPEKEIPQTIEEMTPRGAGLRIMRASMDSVKFDTVPDDGNRLTMRKARGEEP